MSAPRAPLGARLDGRDRFRLFEDRGEGLLVDLASGDYYRLNRAAAAGWRAALSGCTEEQVATWLVELGAGAERAGADARELLSLMAQEAPAREPSSDAPCRFVADVGGFRVESPGGAQLGRLREDGCALQVDATAPPGWILYVLPHALVLQGLAVLHAAAVGYGGRVVALAGASGAGKTTTAAALAGTGGARISEDLLVLDPAPVASRAGEEAGPAVLWGAEADLRSFAGAVSDRPERGERVLDLSVDRLLRGRGAWPRAHLAELWFLDAERRHDGPLALEPLTPIEALPLLLSNSFAELGSTRVFASIFEASAGLARSIDLRRATVPLGVERLGTITPPALAAR